MWHSVVQYIGISISYLVEEMKLGAGSFSEMFLPLHWNTQCITLPKNETITFIVMRNVDLLYGESYYM